MFSRALRWPRVEAGVAALLIVGTAAATVMLARGLRWTDAQAGLLPPGDWTTFATILMRNVSVALGLFSGSVTLGISTGVLLLLVGAMLGWSVALSVATLGVVETLLRCWAYTPFELLGFVLAGAAGLTPVISLLRRPDGVRSPIPWSAALRLLAAALLTLVVAAAVETASIAIHASH